MTQYSGRGNAARSLELLWGTRKSPTRGPSPGLSVDQIVRAAIEIVDADGLGALSMRRVADKLGIGTMSLYTYVPGKAELLDLMLDAVVGELSFPNEPTTWRAALEHRALEDWALYERHPWVLGVSTARSLLGPNETEVFERTMRAVAGVGLSGREMVSAVNLVTGYVRGAAQGVLEASLAARQTGMTDDQWWAEREPIFDRYFDPERFPTLVAAHLDGAFNPPANGADYTLGHAIEDFEFGLKRVLDGIAFLLQQRVAGAG